MAPLGGPLETEGEPRRPYSHSNALETSTETNMSRVPTNRRGGGGKVGGREAERSLWLYYF